MNESNFLLKKQQLDYQEGEYGDLNFTMDNLGAVIIVSNEDGDLLPKEYPDKLQPRTVAVSPEPQSEFQHPSRKRLTIFDRNALKLPDLEDDEDLEEEMLRETRNNFTQPIKEHIVLNTGVKFK